MMEIITRTEIDKETEVMGEDMDVLTLYGGAITQIQRNREVCS